MKMRDNFDRVVRCEKFLAPLLNISEALMDDYSFPLNPLLDKRKDFEQDVYSEIYTKLDGIISSLQQHLNTLNQRLNFDEAVSDFELYEGLDYPLEDEHD